MSNRYFVMGQVFIANGTTTTDKAGRYTTDQTITITGGAGNFTIFMTEGMTGTVTSGSAAITGSVVTLSAGLNTLTADGNGDCTLDVTIGTAANWNTVNNWSAASGGTGGASVPTSSDNVYFDANSFTGASQVLTVDASANCLDMDWTGATNIPALVTTNILRVYGNLTFITNMTWTGAQYIYMHGSGKTLTMAGITGSKLAIDGSASVTLIDNLILANGLWLRSGTLITDNKNITITSIGIFDGASASAFTLTLGSSTISTPAWIMGAARVFTVTANTATINVSGTGAFAGGGIATYHDVNLNGTAHTISGSNTYNKLTVVNSAVITVTAGTTQTYADLEIGDDVTLQSTAGNYNMVLSDATFTSVGSGLSMSDATVTATGEPANVRFWVQDGGNWSDDDNHWSVLSGYLPGGATVTLPTATESVYFDANSFSAGSQTVTVDATAYCLGMDWTGSTNTPTLAGSTNVINTYGNITFIHDMVITNVSGYLFTIKDNVNLTSNGAEICLPDFASIYMATAGKTLSLIDDLNCGILYARFGTLVTNNNTVNCSAITCGAEAHTLTLGSSTINCVTWNNPTGLTLTANTATINCSGTFSGGGITTYNIVNLTGATSTVSGSNTFATFALPAGTTQTITFTDGTTQTATTFTLSGSAGHVHTLIGTATAGWAISKASGRLLGAYLALSYSTATGGASFYARNNSVNTVGNAGWMFREPVGVYK